MDSKSGFIKFILSAAVIAVIGAGGILYFLKSPKSAQEEIPPIHTVTDFLFTEQHGQPFGLENLKGKVSVVDFIFTNCPGACPIMAKEMKPMYTGYQNNDQVQFVSISVDPARDSLKVLQAYAKKQGVTDDRWVFLSAPLQNVETLARDGFLVSDDFPGNHSTKFILVDETGQIRGYYDSFDKAEMEKIRDHIDLLLATK